MKKMTAIALIVLIIAALFNIRQILGIPIIGTISGLENEQIILYDVKYERDDSGIVSRKDKGRYLGIAVRADGKMKMRVYETSDKDYLYALWEWEGAIYKRAR